MLTFMICTKCSGLAAPMLAMPKFHMCCWMTRSPMRQHVARTMRPSSTASAPNLRTRTHSRAATKRTATHVQMYQEIWGKRQHLPESVSTDPATLVLTTWPWPSPIVLDATRRDRFDCAKVPKLGDIKTSNDRSGDRAGLISPTSVPPPIHMHRWRSHHRSTGGIVWSWSDFSATPIWIQSTSFVSPARSGSSGWTSVMRWLVRGPAHRATRFANP